MSDIETRARSIVTEAASKISPIEYIKREVRNMESEDVISLAVAYLYAQVKSRKRAVVREVEQASVSVEPTLGTQRWERWAKKGGVPESRWTEHRKVLASHAENDARLWREANAKIDEALRRYASELKVRWTSELLASEFALGDGTNVTWGGATVEQHESRMRMHKSNAIAGVEGYARHAAAIQELRAKDARTLNEALAVSA